MNNTLVEAHIDSICPLTDTILQVILSPLEFIDYQAGQYLQICSAQEEFSYSIANAPLGSHKYELHIRHSRDNPYNQGLLTEIKTSGKVSIRVPLGDCHLARLHPEKPILFIAGGTGFAPIKAMIEQLLASSDPRLFEFYWGARLQNDLYMDDLATYWQKHVAHFQYFSLLSQAGQETLGSRVISRHQTDLEQWQFVISGPFDMVYNTRDTLLAHGAVRENLFSDAFSFETK